MSSERTNTCTWALAEYAQEEESRVCSVRLQIWHEEEGCLGTGACRLTSADRLTVTLVSCTEITQTSAFLSPESYYIRKHQQGDVKNTRVNRTQQKESPSLAPALDVQLYYHMLVLIKHSHRHLTVKGSFESKTLKPLQFTVTSPHGWLQHTCKQGAGAMQLHNLAKPSTESEVLSGNGLKSWSHRPTKKQHGVTGTVTSGKSSRPVSLSLWVFSTEFECQCVLE